MRGRAVRPGTVTSDRDPGTAKPRVAPVDLNAAGYHPPMPPPLVLPDLLDPVVAYFRPAA